MSFDSKREKISELLTKYNWHTEAELFDNILEEIDNRAISNCSKNIVIDICLKNIKKLFNK